MRSTILSLIFVLFSFIGFAQYTFDVGDGSISYKVDGKPVVFPALTCTVYEANQSLIENLWRNQMKKVYRKGTPPPNPKKPVMRTKMVLVKEFGSKPVEAIYTKVVKNINGTATITIAYNIRGKKSIDSQWKEVEMYEEAKDLVIKFAKLATQRGIQAQVKAAKKAKTDLENKKNSLIRKNSSLERSIKGYEARITKAESQIATNKKEISAITTTKMGEIDQKIVEIQKKFENLPE